MGLTSFSSPAFYPISTILNFTQPTGASVVAASSGSTQSLSGSFTDISNVISYLGITGVDWGASDYLENTLLDYIFGSGVFNPSGNLYVALAISSYEDNETRFTEPGSNYSRVVITNDKSTWSVADNGSLHNLTSIVFNQASSNWGTITYGGIFDNGPGIGSGSLLCQGILSPPQLINSGSIVQFSSGALVINFS